MAIKADLRPSFVPMTLKLEQNVLKCYQPTHWFLQVLSLTLKKEEKKKLDGNSANSHFYNKSPNKLLIDSKLPPSLMSAYIVLQSRFHLPQLPLTSGLLISTCPTFMKLFKNYFFNQPLWGQIPKPQICNSSFWYVRKNQWQHIIVQQACTHLHNLGVGIGVSEYLHEQAHRCTGSPW